MSRGLSKKIRVFVIDDHLMFITGLQSMFYNDPNIQIVKSCTSGSEAFNMLETTPVDVILLDINLPDIDGIELNKQLHKTYPAIKVIALTMHHEISFVSSMIKGGAKGYILKNSSKENLQMAIRAVAGGNTWFDEEVKEALIQSMMPNRNKASNSMVPKLTRREKEILALIIAEHTTQEIAEKLFISLNTVETHRKNLLQKLNVRNTAGLVRFAVEHKLVD